jgi:NAD(P)-dependent dehydrogenase (short-subunit alcohol dehydrogenase family)
VDLELKDRVVLVTGASGDIGRAIAAAFAAEGARVAAGWHTNEGAADAVVASIERAGEAAASVRLDQGDPASITRAVEHVETELGAVDVLVANAVAWPRGSDSWAGLTKSLVTNVAGTLTVAETVVPAMRARRWGRIVLISSDVVQQPMPAGASYPAAKGALEVAARVLALREARHGVLTNVVRPGFTLTDRALTTPGFGRAVIDAEAEKTPTGRICTPEDVAGLVTYLGSAANGHVNGEAISVAGGRELTR